MLGAGEMLLSITCDLESTHGLGFDADDIEIILPSFGSKVRAFPIKWSLAGGRERIKLVTHGGPIKRVHDSNPRYVVFHLVNFPAIRGIPEGTILLEAGGWKISAAQLPDARDNIETMKHAGGFSMTHVGAFERADGDSFDLASAKDLIDCLRYFFSFARGQWAPPILPVGYDADSRVVWEQWSSPLSDPWTFVPSWFDWHHGESLSLLFPGFIRKWTDDIWRKAIRSSIYWYVRANGGSAGTDGGVILTQSALELLSWTQHVEQGALSSGDLESFKHLTN